MVVYFDGVCGFCNQLVQQLLKADKSARLKFAPLQGETAKSELSPEDTENLDSVVVTKDGRTFRESDAVVQLLLELPNYRWLGRALAFIPRVLRDFGYRLVARFRYRIWGSLEACRLPLPEERARFLP